MDRKVNKMMLQEWQMEKLRTKTKCPECGRVFDLMNEEDASEYYNGHDCEE